MITRRNWLIGISAALVSASTIVRIAVPIHPKNYYGFCDRLYINSRYQNGELRGRTLIRLIDDGLLKHIPPAVIAYDLANWGTAKLSSAAREERRRILWPRAKGPDLARPIKGQTI